MPYVGAGVLASALSMDKVTFKELMAQAGIPQVDYRAVRVERVRVRSRRRRSRSSGTSGCRCSSSPPGSARRSGSSGSRLPRSSSRRSRAAFAHDPLVIVEAAAAGTRGRVLGAGQRRPDRLRARRDRARRGRVGWYDYEAKYTPGGMELIVPARISSAARARVQELALETFRRVGCAGLARVDFFVDGDGRARQRAQHDPRVHPDERVRVAVRAPAGSRTRSCSIVSFGWPSSATRPSGVQLLSLCPASAVEGELVDRHRRACRGW